MVRFALVRTGLIIAALLAAFASCVRLAPKTSSLPPAAVPDRFVLCAKVVRTADWADLALVGETFFRDRDDAVCAVIDFKALRDAHRLVWKWYNPSGRLVRTSEPVGIGEDGAEYDRFLAWDEFPVSGETSAGRYTVALFIDGRYAGSKEFEMKTTGGSGSAPGGDAEDLSDADQRAAQVIDSLQIKNRRAVFSGDRR